MYRLLIVDDEEYITDGLYELFSSKTEPTLDVYKMYSAKSALEFMKTVRIDIVISDIKMPGTDGIEMAKKINELWPKCKIIFLTGHKSADYAISAIKYKAVDYILKTESDEVLENAVKKAIELIKKENRILFDNDIIEDADKFEKSLSKQFFMDLLVFDGGGDTETKQMPPDISLDAGEPCLIGAAFLECEEKFRIYNAYKINDMLRKSLSGNILLEFDVLDNGTLVWVAQSGECADLTSQLIGAMESVSDSIVNYDLSVNFAVYDELIGFSYITAAFLRIRQILLTYSVKNSGLVLTNSFFESKVRSKYSGLYRENYAPSLLLVQMKMALESNNRDKYFTVLNSLCEYFTDDISLNFPPAVELYCRIVLEIMSFINAWNSSERFVLDFNMNKILDPASFSCWSEASSRLASLSASLFDSREININETRAYITRQIKDFINGNIGGDLSLVTIADSLSLNPSYISRHFKDVEGINISQYISGKKIKKAKSMLEANSIKIHEIASLLGFETNSYFTRFFKKETGMTPHEYREKTTE